MADRSSLNKKSHFSKEMGITRDDLYRALPAIFEGQQYKIRGDAIISQIDQRTVKINITKEDYRNLASMKVPRLVLDFCFENYAQDQIDNFTQRFLLYLHKGGG